MRSSEVEQKSDSVCQSDESMNTAQGRGEEDDINDSLSSVLARGQEEYTPHADRVGTDDEWWLRWGRQQGHAHWVRLSESDFCVSIEGQDEDVFFLLEADIEIQEQVGKPITEKVI